MTASLLVEIALDPDDVGASAAAIMGWLLDRLPSGTYTRIVEYDGIPNVVKNMGPDEQAFARASTLGDRFGCEGRARRFVTDWWLVDGSPP